MWNCPDVPGSFRWNMWSAGHVRTYQYWRTWRSHPETMGAISWIPSTSNICLIGQISHNWSNIWRIIKIFSMYGKVFSIMFFFRVIPDCEAHHLVFSIFNLSSLKCCCRSLSIFCYLKSKMFKDDQLSWSLLLLVCWAFEINPSETCLYIWTDGVSPGISGFTVRVSGYIWRLHLFGGEIRFEPH